MIPEDVFSIKLVTKSFVFHKIPQQILGHFLPKFYSEFCLTSRIFFPFAFCLMCFFNFTSPIIMTSDKHFY